MGEKQIILHDQIVLDGKQDGNSVKNSRESRFRLRRLHGRILHGNIGIHGADILQNLMKGRELFFFFF